MDSTDSTADRPKINNSSLKGNVTNEMFLELEDTFMAAAEGGFTIPLLRLPLALKTLGMSINESNPKLHLGEIDFDTFLEIVQTCMKQPTWAMNEMMESYSLWDKDSTGSVGPMQLRVVFTRLGENLLEKEVKEQLKDIDIDSDLQMALSEYCQMVSSTRGVDFEFDDNV